MSVLLETSLGDLVIDLDVNNCPKVCENFLKLSKTFYYTHNVFFSVQRGFLAQAGDPSATGSGGACVWNQLPSSSRDRQTSRFFRPELKPSLRHRRRGTVSMALTALRGGENDGDLVAGSQFFVTLDDGLDYLDGKHAPFGSVVEGDAPGDTIDKINAAFTDAEGRPLQDIRIRHVEILDDPFEDPEGLVIPSRAPTPPLAPRARLGDDEALEDTRTEAERELDKRNTETKAAALTLEIVGDLPFAEVRPPENILFVCKLNPVTRGEDLRLLFGRFGDILSCEVIRDKKTGDSLQYAFIEFDKREAAEKAYFSMQNVLVDDRRIWVDFSQSVSNLHKSWLRTRVAGGRNSRQRPDSQERSRPRARSRSPSAPHSRQSAHAWEHDSGRRNHQRSREDDEERDSHHQRADRHRREEERYRDGHRSKHDDARHVRN